MIKLIIGDQKLKAKLESNSSAEALLEQLKDGPLTLSMSDYGNMEKVGYLPSVLPRNDQQITTKAGDLILYQGNAFVIYYAPNSWNFTKIGEIQSITDKELLSILGKGNVNVTLEID